MSGHLVIMPVLIPFLAGALLTFFMFAAWHWPSQDERTPPWKGRSDG